MDLLLAIFGMFAILAFLGWLLEKLGFVPKPHVPRKPVAANIIATGRSLSGLTVEIFDNTEFHRADPVWPKYSVISADETGYTRELVSTDSKAEAERIFRRICNK
jgi:hypothetical protein